MKHGSWLYVAGVVAVAALVAVASLGTLVAAVAVLAATGLLLFCALGPTNLGVCAVIAAMFFAPMDNVRPSASVSVVTVSDVFLVLGLVLLVPVMLQQRPRLPAQYLLAAAALVAGLFVSSLLSPQPVTALTIGMRLIIAAVAVPLAFMAWNPSHRLITLLAGAYVAGQVVSLGYGLVDGPLVNNRYIGLSTHVNYFGHSGLIAFCLFIFIEGRVSGAARAATWFGGGLVGLSIVLSGSRAAVLAAVVIVILFPVVERSLVAAYVLVFGAVALVVLGSQALQGLSGVPSLSRFFGDDTTTTSDQTRREGFATNIDKFLHRPIQGHGFDELGLSAHNVFLEVAVALGIIGLIPFLVILWCSARPLFTPGPLHRLGYVGLSFVSIASITNTVWDRFVWLPLALALTANLHAPRAHDTPDTGPPDAVHKRRARTSAKELRPSPGGLRIRGSGAGRS